MGVLREESSRSMIRWADVHISKWVNVLIFYGKKMKYTRTLGDKCFLTFVKQRHVSDLLQDIWNGY